MDSVNFKYPMHHYTTNGIVTFRAQDEDGDNWYWIHTEGLEDSYWVTEEEMEEISER